MGSDDQGKDGIFGRGLPGTGGDISLTDDGKDVEGHKPRKFDGSDEEDDGLVLRARIAGDPDEVDVEGHLYTGGPRTQGEFTRRGPGENPHGER